MKYALWLLVAQGLLGAFDTLYFHEYRARLPALGVQAHEELQLHAYRDFIYAILFATLPYFVWTGVYAWLIVGLLGTEIVLTLRDFVVEDDARRTLGGLYKGERVAHGIMGILYGLFLAQLIPQLWEWSQRRTGFSAQSTEVSGFLKVLMVLLAIGVLVSGLRDLGASRGSKFCMWPWTPPPSD